MDSLPLHPSIVHVPIALAVLMPFVAIGLLLAWWRDWLPRRTWFVALALQGALVAGALAAMQTGEADEERVERVLPSEAPIETHEEAAELFMWTAVAVLGLFVVGAFIPKESAGLAVGALAVVGTLAVAGLGYRVGHAGGELVYREGAASAYTGRAVTTSAAYQENDEESDESDDD